MPESFRALRNTSRLAPACDNQDEQFCAAFSILREAITRRAFPAASTAVTYKGGLLAVKSFGACFYPEPGVPLPTGFGRSGSSQVSPATLFDLASLTKPVATTTMAMILYERGQLELDAPIAALVPEFTRGQSDLRRRCVTFRHLLAHCSGLPAYGRLFLKAPSRDDLLHGAFSTPLSADPISHAEYSDIGFIILGVALERMAEESLDAFCQREIFGPLGMSNTTFHPPAAMRQQIPPTADERQQPCGSDPAGGQPRTFRNRIIQGEVQDENAFVLGGVAGHAGLFATADDIARYAETMLTGGNPILLPETISLFTRRESSPPDTTRTLGWDTPSTPSQSGKHFGPRSYGHLGYTGTSLWIDPDRQLSITLLTNRTWPDCSNQAIKQVRPKFHDAIVEALS
jgi:serine-type D-Ala-D-Ala carboxypeptidase